MDLKLPELDSQILKANATYNGAIVELTLAGAADLRVEAAFDAAIKALHQETSRLGADEVVVNLKDLEFINSACLKALVCWISEIREQEGKKYKLRFLKNPAVSWQERSLHSLQCFGEDIVVIDN